VCLRLYGKDDRQNVLFPERPLRRRQYEVKSAVRSTAMNVPSNNITASKLHGMITKIILPSGSNKDTVNDE